MIWYVYTVCSNLFPLFWLSNCGTFSFLNVMSKSRHFEFHYQNWILWTPDHQHWLGLHLKKVTLIVVVDREQMLENDSNLLKGPADACPFQKRWNFSFKTYYFKVHTVCIIKIFPATQFWISYSTAKNICMIKSAICRFAKE